MRSRAAPQDTKATTPQASATPKPVKRQSWLAKQVDGVQKMAQKDTDSIAESVAQNKGKIAVASVVAGIATLPYTAPGIVTAAEATYDGFDVAQDFAWNDAIVPGANFAWNDVVVPGAAATGDFLLNDAIIPGAEFVYEEGLTPWAGDMDEFFHASDAYNTIVDTYSPLGNETTWNEMDADVRTAFGEDTWGDWNPNTNGIGDGFRTAFGEDTWGDWNPNTNGIGDGFRTAFGEDTWGDWNPNTNGLADTVSSDIALEAYMYVGIAAAAGVAAFIVGALVQHFLKKTPEPRNDLEAAHKAAAEENLAGLDARLAKAGKPREEISAETFDAENSQASKNSFDNSIDAEEVDISDLGGEQIDGAQAAKSDATSFDPADVIGQRDDQLVGAALDAKHTTADEADFNSIVKDWGDEIDLTSTAPASSAAAPTAARSNQGWTQQGQGPAAKNDNGPRPD